jgi:ribose transport system substrate-binding protein
VALALVVGLISLVTVTSAGASKQAGGQKYTAILSNPFIGNDWRPQMQKYASVVATKPPLAPSISSLRIVTTQNNDPGLQSTALQSAILEKPDILLIDAASETALNGLIQSACNKGITVVTFDIQASAPCAWQLAPDWVAVGKSYAEWIAKTIKGKGLILVDKGTPGTASSNNINKGVQEVLSQYPGIKQISYYSKFSPGTETAAVTQLLASHRDVKGILSQSYAGQDAQQKAGLKLPATGFTFPPAMSGCVSRNVPCYLVGVPPWISADALRLAVDVKDGKVTGKPRFVPFLVPRFVNNSNVKPQVPNLGEVYPLAPQFKDAPKGAFLPASPPWVKINFAKEILG